MTNFYDLRRRLLMLVHDKSWGPNDNRAKARAGRAQHDLTRTAARSRSSQVLGNIAIVVFLVAML